ncbi:MAG: alpha/beta fold hydrolase [Spirochaetia bacterium]
MDLAFRELGGDGPPIVILHGLFGSSQNWAGVGRRLAVHGATYALDLRNHGDSPHAPTHSLSDCVGDLHDWATAHARGPLRLIGHSMGGLVAMGFALSHPKLTAGVASVDIAPRPYPRNHEQQFRALHTDISGCANRAELDVLLAPLITDKRERQFLLMNAVREGAGFRWRCNVEAMEKHTVAEDFAHVSGSYTGPSLLVGCGKSPYVRPSDHDVMRRLFPNTRIETLPHADHWPHVTAPTELLSILESFLDAIKSPPSRR